MRQHATPFAVPRRGALVVQMGTSVSACGERVWQEQSRAAELLSSPRQEPMCSSLLDCAWHSLQPARCPTAALGQ
jgi:hypothetical protein